LTISASPSSTNPNHSLCPLPQGFPTPATAIATAPSAFTSQILWLGAVVVVTLVDNQCQHRAAHFGGLRPCGQPNPSRADGDGPTGKKRCSPDM
jgi:hypothetical protein